MLSMNIGYARTSTVDQAAGLEAQLTELNAIGCQKIFYEQVSSVSLHPELKAAIEFARAGDVWVVTKIDRLVRSVGDLLAVIKMIFPWFYRHCYLNYFWGVLLRAYRELEEHVGIITTGRAQKPNGFERLFIAEWHLSLLKISKLIVQPLAANWFDRFYAKCVTRVRLQSAAVGRYGKERVDNHISIAISFIRKLIYYAQEFSNNL